ncbi:Pimeloyl-[acyl-carrier protein] methyl ester esterase [Roseovarius litorisediminis]|uniref:Pimeloyl-[acyl-carrier protein] methyl ester esterase n=1 Tax=Roseovarius litorisediminis TaxID=1312363 RepID=A0A1Y5RX96_9RHOB|nr:alpha/beta hydrolase [Roseovarius litorisediminis]SLN24675.1 Pimeloyl-[acyl-carrier protein] methyl ester esterase [Roseovarius litorisediminis]
MPRSLKAGFETYWTTFGQGPRDALMIHCSLASSSSWSRLAPCLSGMLKMTAFDMPGHGRSAAWDGRGEIQEETAQIAAAFLNGPADIIGHSFGATVALRLAIERPDLVRSLVLIEPVFFAVAFADHLAMRVDYHDLMAGYAQALEEGDNLAAARAFNRVWGDGTAWADIPARQREAMAERVGLVAEADGALFDDVGGMLSPGGLDSIKVPVLLLEGSASPPVIAAINEGLAARLNRVERSVVVGARHMLPISHPEQVADEVLRFLQRT